MPPKPTVEERQCIIPGCKNLGRHEFNLRLRRKDHGGANTSAIIGHDNDAWLCDDHCNGLEIDVYVRWHSTSPGGVTTTFIGIGENQRIAERAYP